MPRDDAVVLDIEHAARLAQQFVAGLDRDGFLADVKSQSAVLHQLPIIGEAVKRLSSQYRDAHPLVPWGLIAGMRDKLIHAYDAVDLEEVWRTVQRDLPNLLTELAPDSPGAA
ncbi:hypothetical protein RAS1_10910 [Phycisphaerae bacterium RAS1]|nr:hypothetical protein RAS1_10910 [Phycisphaerae bacterium RAS1]